VKRVNSHSAAFGLLSLWLGLVVAATLFAFDARSGDAGSALPLSQPHETPRCEAPRLSGSSQTGGPGGLMVPLTLDALTDEADLIVTGRVQRLQSCIINRDIATLVSIAPESLLKERLQQPLGAGFVTITVPGGTFGGYRLAVGTSPDFTVGEHVVAFLTDIPGHGLMPAGGFQGKLTIGDDGTNPETGLMLEQLGDRIAQARAGELSGGEDPLQSYLATVESLFVILGKIPNSTMPVPIYVNPNTGRPAQITAAQTRTASGNAFSTWENDAGSSIDFNTLTDTTRVSGADGCAPGDPPDGNFDTTWGIDGSHPPGVLAVTFSCLNPATNPNTILDADVEIDTDHVGVSLPSWTVTPATCTSEFDLQTVLLHEYGHLIGLDHSTTGLSSCPNICPLMRSDYVGVKRTLCTDDQNGAAALYPAASPTPTPSPSPTPSPTSTPLISGDVDCDGDVDILDILTQLRDIVGLVTSAGCLSAGNVNCTGGRDILDVLAMLQFTVGIPVTLPPGCPPIGT